MFLLQVADAGAATAATLVLPRELAIRLGIDLACVIVLVRLIYYRRYRHADLFLTYFAFNLVIFLITFLLNRADISLGAAFGLFAVFSMLRYRTEGLSARDMTYLFLVISLGLVMAISPGGWLQLALVGATVLVVTQLLEGDWLTRREATQHIVYDNIKLVDAHARAELIRDLRERTGLDVVRVEVQEIDLVKDSARLVVYYRTNGR